MNGKNKFNHNYLLVSHYATYAMQDLLYEFLTTNNAHFIKKINIPLPELPFIKKIEIEEYKNGRVIKTKTVSTIIHPSIIAYIIHFIQFVLLIINDKYSYDLIIAENSLLVLAALFLKKIGRIKKIIFYCHGVAGDRFNTSIVNRIYEFLDRIAAQHSDQNWLLSKKMINVRLQQGIKKENIFWVPTALQISKIKRKDSVKSNHLLFLGTLNQMNGVMLLPDIIRELIKTLPNVSLNIIGDGPLKTQLQEKIEKYHLKNKINLLGIQRFNDYRNTLTNYVIGLAPYVPSKDNLLNSTDPMKIRLYMAAGLPILTTTGFPFSLEIVQNQLGYAVDFSTEAYVKKLIFMLNKFDILNRIRQKNLIYSKQFDQKLLFKKPILNILYEKR